MKRKIYSKLSLLSLLILLVVIGACKKDEEEKILPSISIIEEAGYLSSDTTLKAGDEIKIKVLLQGGDQNITNFVINVITDSATTTYFDTAMNIASLSWHGTFFKSFAPTEEWEFIVYDREGYSAGEGFTLSLDTTASYQPLNSFSSIVLGAQDNGQLGECFNPYDASIHFIEDADQDTAIQTGVELLYYYYGDDKNVIASPGANIEDEVYTVNTADWTIVNTTRYIETGLSVDDFNQAVNDSIILANYNEGDAKRKAKKLQADEVFTFRTQKGKLGMFLVKEVDGTTEGSINIDIKIQQ